MDGQRFDNLMRALARGSSRRGLLKGLMGGALGSALAVTRRGGLADDTVQICYMTDDPSNPVVLITVSSDAIPAHESHGDVINPDFQNDASNCGGCLVSCDDGDSCTTDICSAGKCVHTQIVCDNSNPCTDVACVDGACVATPAPGRGCDDGNACTENDTCDDTGACVGTPISCDDDNACTIDSCDPKTGCAHEPISCDDGDPCTIDSCDTTTGCVHTQIDCSDLDDQCNAGTCNASGQCEKQPANVGAPCDDHNACTANATCQPDGSCVGDLLICYTPDQCQVQVGGCDPDTGCTYEPRDCDDHDVCTIDSCDSNFGCIYTRMECTSDDVCKVATGDCDPTTGCVFEDLDCSDLDDQCNVGICVSGVGCQKQAANDGEACTTTSDLNGTCASGTCTPNMCDNAFLQGTSDGSLPLCVDDELIVTVNGVQAFEHTGTVACLDPISLGPVTNGDSIEVVALNSPITCGEVSLSTLFLACPDAGKVQTLDAVGVPITPDQPCGEVFYDKIFTVDF